MGAYEVSGVDSDAAVMSGTAGSANIHLNDAIGRLSINELIGFNTLSVNKIRHHTAKDQAVQLLTQHISNSFPESSMKIPDSIKVYFSFSLKWYHFERT